LKSKAALKTELSACAIAEQSKRVTVAGEGEGEKREGGRGGED